MQRVNLTGRSWNTNRFLSLWEKVKKLEYRSNEWPTDLPGRWSGRDAARTNAPPESRSWPRRRTPASMMAAARMLALPMQDAHTSSSSSKSSAQPRSPSFSPSLQQISASVSDVESLALLLTLLAPWLPSNPPTQPTLDRKENPMELWEPNTANPMEIDDPKQQKWKEWIRRSSPSYGSARMQFHKHGHGSFSLVPWTRVHDRGLRPMTVDFDFKGFYVVFTVEFFR